ncbi:hypothetical protein ACWGS9_33125 [Bradyrhizobium sp. Arg314]
MGLLQIYARLDPVRLLRDMRSAQQRLVAIADQSPPPAPVTEPALDRFLSGLRTAWKEGEIRPTAKLKPKQKIESKWLPFALSTLIYLGIVIL